MSEVSEIAALMKQRADAEAAIARRDMALKLSENPEFKHLILRVFCVEECARYAQLSADPGISAAAQADSLALAQAAGHLRRFLSVCMQMGDAAQGQLQSIDDTIEQLRVEEAGGNE